MKPRIITYHIDPSLGKDGAKCVQWALGKWTSWLAGEIKFEPRPKDQADWRFEMRHHPNWPDKIAKCIHTSPGKADIIFDPREPWAMTRFQRAFGKGDCLRTYAVHEGGHALGIHHSEDSDSVMFHQPRYVWIDRQTLNSIS